MVQSAVKPCWLVGTVNVSKCGRYDHNQSILDRISGLKQPTVSRMKIETLPIQIEWPVSPSPKYQRAYGQQYHSRGQDQSRFSKVRSHAFGLLRPNSARINRDR